MRSTTPPTNRKKEFATTRAISRWCWGGSRRCPVVLGSATPSAESFDNARRGRYRLLRMTRRVMERPMAEVEIVDLRAEFKKDPARAKNGAARRRRCEKTRSEPQRGAAFGAAARRAARQSRRRRAERGVSQPPRLSQLPAMPSLRQRDLVRQLQRQHDVPPARPFTAMPLVRLRARRPGSVSRVQRLRTGGPGLRHRAADGGAGRSAARRRVSSGWTATPAGGAGCAWSWSNACAAARST